jgi:hypothetical protein
MYDDQRSHSWRSDSVIMSLYLGRSYGALMAIPSLNRPTMCRFLRVDVDSLPRFITFPNVDHVEPPAVIPLTQYPLLINIAHSSTSHFNSSNGHDEHTIPFNLVITKLCNFQLMNQ